MTWLEELEMLYESRVHLQERYNEVTDKYFGKDSDGNWLYEESFAECKKHKERGLLLDAIYKLRRSLEIHASKLIELAKVGEGG